jgi:uncharacterized protein YbjT (DUF2867 family)
MKVIVTGATGMVGHGVLLEALDDHAISEVLSISRNSTGIKHPKLRELLHKDFSDFSSVQDQLIGFDACYHCMGVSSAGMNEADYSRMTYVFTMALAQTLYRTNPEMTFIYVSGVGTDSSEKGRMMWARVKGKTENDLLKLGFKQAYMFRPGAIIPKRGVAPKAKATRITLNLLGWILPVLKWLNPSSVTDTIAIGKAMIAATKNGYEKGILLPKDINSLHAS